jgi:hypothetical protein
MMESSLGVNDLVIDLTYEIYHSGGNCKEMETRFTRKFLGLNEQGNPLFYDESMMCPVVFDLKNNWTFYRL